VTGHAIRAHRADRGRRTKAGMVERLDARQNRDLTQQRALEKSLLYSEELGIDLAAGRDDACFRWLLASILFGARISETTARKTYWSFIRHGLTRPRRIIAAGWDFLINPIMREGGYVRYDGRKSTQVLRDCDTLIAEYGGKLRQLHDAARNAPCRAPSGSAVSRDSPVKVGHSSQSLRGDLPGVPRLPGLRFRP
jgi:hypothetical protein